MVKQNWGAHLLLIDSQKRFLLQLRNSKATKYPNYWSLFGGRIEKNETPKDALKREIYEEINYKCREPKLLVKDNINRVYIFIEEFDSSQQLLLQEGEDMKWFSKDEIVNLKIPKYVREVIDTHFED